MKRILVLASGSYQWGSGHLRRSLEISYLLAKQDFKISSGALTTNLNQKGLESILSQYDCCFSSVEEIQIQDVDAIVVDVHEDMQPKVYNWVKSLNKPVIALDWYFGGDDCISAKINLRGDISNLKYAIIRREFRQDNKRISKQDKEFDLFMSLGSRDDCGALRTLFEFLNNIEFSDKKIVIVPAVMGEEFSALSQENIQIIREPVSVSELMGKSKVGISNGGTTLMELMSLGIPTIVFPQSKQEEVFTQRVFDYGCSVKGVLDRSVFSKQCNMLWSDKELYDQMSIKAEQLVDGRGSQRILQIIENIVNH